MSAHRRANKKRESSNQSESAAPYRNVACSTFLALALKSCFLPIELELYILSAAAVLKRYQISP
jgi:hypothetical protein